MPAIINILIAAGVLWGLLIIFNEGGNFKYVQQQAFIIIGFVSIVGLSLAVILPEPFDLMVPVAQAATLFLCVEKISQLSRPAAVRITAWYFAVIFMIGLGFAPLG